MIYIYRGGGGVKAHTHTTTTTSFTQPTPCASHNLSSRRRHSTARPSRFVHRRKSRSERRRPTTHFFFYSTQHCSPHISWLLFLLFPSFLLIHTHTHTHTHPTHILLPTHILVTTHTLFHFFPRLCSSPRSPSFYFIHFRFLLFYTFLFGVTSFTFTAAFCPYIPALHLLFSTTP